MNCTWRTFDTNFGAEKCFFVVEIICAGVWSISCVARIWSNNEHEINDCEQREHIFFGSILWYRMRVCGVASNDSKSIKFFLTEFSFGWTINWPTMKFHYRTFTSVTSPPTRQIHNLFMWPPQSVNQYRCVSCARNTAHTHGMHLFRMGSSSISPIPRRVMTQCAELLTIDIRNWTFEKSYERNTWLLFTVQYSSVSEIPLWFLVFSVLCLVASRARRRSNSKTSTSQHASSIQTVGRRSLSQHNIFIQFIFIFGHMSSMSGGGGAAMLNVFYVLSLACLLTANCISSRALRAQRYALVCVLLAADFDFVSVILRGIIISSLLLLNNNNLFLICTTDASNAETSGAELWRQTHSNNNNIFHSMNELIVPTNFTVYFANRKILLLPRFRSKTLHSLVEPGPSTFSFIYFVFFPFSSAISMIMDKDNAFR